MMSPWIVRKTRRTTRNIRLPHPPEGGPRAGASSDHRLPPKGRSYSLAKLPTLVQDLESLMY